MKKVIFVSRHRGAWDWFKASPYFEKFQDVELVPHLDTSIISKGDVVIGTLPIHLAAEVCKKGAEFWYLSLNLTPDQRGKELSASEMAEVDGSLSRFSVILKKGELT